jgi:para-aminobenzoate synthetase component II
VRAQVLVLDNYDSFTHNLVDELEQLGARVAVARNDAIEADAVLRGGWRGVVLSPGPGRPEDAGICVDLIRRADERLPILGVCLGHQALGLAHGGRVVRARRPLHGSATPMRHRGEGLLAGLPQGFLAARYHSLVVSRAHPGRGIVPTASSPDGDIMALRHATLPQEGVQFHPESYLTPHGPRILAAFLRRCGLRPRSPHSVRV